MLSRFQTTSRSLSVWATVGLAFFLPISPPPVNLMYALVLLGWLGSGNWTRKWEILRSNLTTCSIAALVSLILLGTTYGASNASDSMLFVTKYSALILIPILISLELNTQEKWRALDAFCLAMVITLLLSILIWLNWLPASWFKDSSPSNPTVFKLHITQGFFMVLAAFIMFQKARMHTGRTRWFLLGLVLLAIINALLMTKGRTGQLIVLVLLAYLFHLRFPRGGLLMGLTASMALLLATYTLSPAFKDRADLAIHEAQQWHVGQGHNMDSSIGLRLDFYTTSLTIISEHPILGVGTGGFPTAYRQHIQGTALAFTENPHNQYLLITAQLGVIGLAALLAMYLACWRDAQALPAPFSHLAIGILLAYLVGNLFNSFMLDFSERFFFSMAIGLLLSLSRTMTNKA